MYRSSWQRRARFGELLQFDGSRHDWFEHRGECTYAKEIERIAKTPLLIIDDFGLLPFDINDRLALLEILENRYRKWATVVVSQLPLDSWHEAIGEPTPRRCDPRSSRPYAVYIRPERRFYAKARH